MEYSLKHADKKNQIIIHKCKHTNKRINIKKLDNLKYTFTTLRTCMHTLAYKKTVTQDTETHKHTSELMC